MNTSFKQGTSVPVLICFILTIMLSQSITAQKVTPIIIPINPDNINDIQNELQRSNNDLWLDENLYAIAPNAMWPYQQVECFYFLSDYNIIGDSAPVEVVNDISIYEEFSQSIVFSDSVVTYIESLPYAWEPSPFDDCFTPENYITQYTGTYSIASDCIDPNPNNNQRSFHFEITENIFSKETGPTLLVVPDANNWDPEEPHSWAYGNHYRIVNGCPVAVNAVFGLGNTENTAGRLLSISLYKWESDSNDDSNMDPDERELVGINFYEIAGNEQPENLITIPLLSYPIANPNEFMVLDSDTDYVLMIEYNTVDQIDIFLATSDEFNYDGQRFASTEAGFPRYGSMLGVNGDLESEPYSSVGFVNDLTAVARLTIDDLIIDDLNEANDKMQRLDIQPNPVSNYILINTTETYEFQNGNIIILNQKGQKIWEKETLPTMDSQIEINVSHLANGLYFVLLQNKRTALSGSFIVQH